MEGTGLPEGVHVTGRRIAVVGSGVSGITAGYVLSHFDYVTIFEADERLGGHADTHLVTPPSGPPLGVDTGFIVYNEPTYPLLTRLFAELGVATEPSEMSMSVRCAGCGLEYAGKRGLGGLTPGLLRGQQRARYLHMLADIPRFHRAARRHLTQDVLASQDHPDHVEPPTLGEFLQSLPTTQDYIVTLGGENRVDPGQFIDRMDYAHPAYTPAAVAAQRRLPELNAGVTAFAGAYHGWGFHEDGCRSGVQAARALGGTW